jgi:hypothetical protein
MKYIITEEQNIRIIKTMSEILKEKFKDSRFVCGIEITPINKEDLPETMQDYDIMVYLKNDWVKLYNVPGYEGIKKGIKIRIKYALLDWFGFDEDKYYVGFSRKDC